MARQVETADRRLREGRDAEDGTPQDIADQPPRSVCGGGWCVMVPANSVAANIGTAQMPIRA